MTPEDTAAVRRWFWRGSEGSIIGKTLVVADWLFIAAAVAAVVVTRDAPLVLRLAAGSQACDFLRGMVVGERRSQRTWGALALVAVFVVLSFTINL